jgi:uncharacterized protein (TIGR03790 family)
VASRPSQLLAFRPLNYSAKERPLLPQATLHYLWQCAFSVAGSVFKLLKNKTAHRISTLGISLFSSINLHAGESPSNVLVLANSHLKDSLELAKHYAKVRQIPSKNIITLPMSLQEEISWEEFSSDILNPLRETLLIKGFLEGGLENNKDVFGRKEYTPLFNNSKYLVLCRGTPLRLKNEVSKISDEIVNKQNKIYRTTVASVDAELSLIPSKNQNPVAYTRNPIFNLKRPNSVAQENVLIVSRLDGPTHKACMRLIQSAQEGENAAYGRAYIDSGGPHKQGNDWMANIVSQLNQKGFSITQETSAKLFHSGHRFDAPVLYFGWHRWHAEGPFSRIDFNVPSGALLFHLHSYSAQTLRSDRQNWVGPIVAAGAAGTIGNVSEPYLHLTHHLHKLCEGILEGKSLGEAAYYSLPALSWQAVLIGDPLYRPNLNPTRQDKTSEIQGFNPFHLEQYGVIKDFRVNFNSGKEKEAVTLAQEHLTLKYGLPLALEITKTMPSLLDNKALIQNLFIPIANYRPKHFQECVPILEAAKLLQNYGLSELANKIFHNLKESKVLPSEIGWRELQN